MKGSSGEQLPLWLLKSEGTRSEGAPHNQLKCLNTHTYVHITERVRDTHTLSPHHMGTQPSWLFMWLLWAGEVMGGVAVSGAGR